MRIWPSLSWRCCIKSGCRLALECYSWTAGEYGHTGLHPVEHLLTNDGAMIFHSCIFCGICIKAIFIINLYLYLHIQCICIFVCEYFHPCFYPTQLFLSHKLWFTDVSSMYSSFLFFFHFLYVFFALYLYL